MTEFEKTLTGIFSNNGRDSQTPWALGYRNATDNIIEYLDSQDTDWGIAKNIKKILDRASQRTGPVKCACGQVDLKDREDTRELGRPEPNPCVERHAFSGCRFDRPPVNKLECACPEEVTLEAKTDRHVGLGVTHSFYTCTYDRFRLDPPSQM